MIVDLFNKRQIADCFYIHIPLADKCDEEILQAVKESREIEKAVELMLDGSMSINDLLDSVEHIFPNMDEYATDVEANLGETLQACFS